MPRKGQTTRQARREERQEDLRERIRNSKVLTHLLDALDEIRDLDPGADTFANELAQLREANAVRLKLLDKVVPTLKAVDLDVEGGLKLVAIDMTGIDPEAAQEPAGDNKDPDPVSADPDDE